MVTGSDTFGETIFLVMNPDGTGVRQLPTPGADIDPSWSPDGERLAFANARCESDDPCWEIWVAEVDGFNERPLTPGSAPSEGPDWSPDGKRIAFARWQDDEGQVIDIYVMNADGSGLRRLTDGSGLNEHPSWSPDGERIAFSRYIDNEYSVWVMNADGTQQRRVTQTAHSPEWSPDGARIAFVQHDAETIATMNADGSEARTLSRPQSLDSDSAPVWSPDGSQIVFVRWSEVWVMDADGRNARLLRSFPADVEGLDWAAAPG